MAKQSNYTEADLHAMGMEEISPGVYAKKKLLPEEIFSKGLGIKPALLPTDFNGRDKVKIIDTLSVKNNAQFKANPISEWFIKDYSVPSKKNSRQNFVNSNGKQLSIPSKQHAEYVKMTAMQYDIFGKEFRKAVEYYQLKFPLKIEFTFIRSTKHSFDYCNACQTCEDIMKDKYDKKGNLIKRMWIPDDSAEYIKPSFGDYEYDKQNPGVRIKLIL